MYSNKELINIFEIPPATYYRRLHRFKCNRLIDFDTSYLLTQEQAEKIAELFGMSDKIRLFLKSKNK